MCDNEIQSEEIYWEEILDNYEMASEEELLGEEFYADLGDD